MRDEPPARPAPAGQATAIFAGGCFWCTEAASEQLAGVSDVQSGYAGGTKGTANYEAVCRGDSGHAEAIRITYDPARISYDQLLDVFFAGSASDAVAAILDIQGERLSSEELARIELLVQQAQVEGK